MTRRIGRTTKMLEHAKELAAAGEAVVIVTADNDHASTLRRLLPQDTSIRVVSSTTGGVDFAAAKFRGSPASVLFDHYATERWIERLERNIRDLSVETEELKTERRPREKARNQ